MDEMRRMRVDVEARVVEAMTGRKFMSLTQVVDSANVDADFILGRGAVRACLDRMATEGKVVVGVGMISNMTLFWLDPNRLERA